MMFEEVNGRPFTRLVHGKLGLACKLSITFFEAEGTLSVGNKGGDIDNKVKSCIDALCLPLTSQLGTLEKLGVLETGKTGTTTIHCLLQDDSLVWNINLQRKRWLEPEPKNSAVLIMSNAYSIACCQTIVKMWHEA